MACDRLTPTCCTPIVYNMHSHIVRAFAIEECANTGRYNTVLHPFSLVPHELYLAKLTLMNPSPFRRSSA